MTLDASHPPAATRGDQRRGNNCEKRRVFHNSHSHSYHALPPSFHSPPALHPSTRLCSARVSIVEMPLALAHSQQCCSGISAIEFFLTQRSSPAVAQPRTYNRALRTFRVLSSQFSSQFSSQLLHESHTNKINRLMRQCPRDYGLQDLHH